MDRTCPSSYTLPLKYLLLVTGLDGPLVWPGMVAIMVCDPLLFACAAET